MSGLLDARTIRALAAELDLRPTKQRGQNFVIDANTVRRIVALAQVEPDDVALEIGPGLGSLTLGLLEVAAHVTAVEIETSLAEQLPKTAAAAKVLAALGAKKALGVDDAANLALARSVRNLDGSDFLAVEGLNVYDILRHDALVLTADTAKKLEASLS